MFYSKNNPILKSDSYKYSHYLQFPNDIAQVSAYVEPRWCREKDEDVMFFGLQMFLQEYMTRRITMQDVFEAQSLITQHGLPFNFDGFARIVQKQGGYWPVIIQALPEGTLHNHRVTQVQVRNSTNDPELAWVTTFIETQLVRAIWYPVNVATRSFHAKKIIKKYLEQTADNLDSLVFKLHDFGDRGVSSEESAAIGGCAHLVNFRGTDTVPALIYANNYYGEKVAGFSIPAAEHSTITSWGRDQEIGAYGNMINNFGGPGKMFAMVLDSYDVYNALENIIGGNLKEKIKTNGAVVGCRLDSGDPTEEPLKAMKVLGRKFGIIMNSKGYKMLPPYLRIVQGDGMNLDTIEKCCRNLMNAGWSVENIGTFGMGGELLQRHDRDTHGYAMKCNAVNKLDSNGWYDISKNPVGDPEKKSKAGRRAVLEKTNNGVRWFEDVREDSLNHRQISLDNVLQTVYMDGEMLNSQTFTQIRERADSFLNEKVVENA